MAANLEVLLENRVSENFTDTGSRYFLRAGVVRRTGDIDPAVFVMLIDAENSNDTFERVANLTDLSTLLAARADAIAQGEDYYRVSNVDIEFDDADLARAGLTATEDAINSLVREFNDFIGAGSPSSSVQKVITGVDKTFLETLKSEYQTTQGEITELEASETSLQSEIDVLKESLDTQQSRIQTFSTARTALFNAIETAYNGHVTQYAAILGFSALTGPETTQVTGYQTNAQAAVAALPATFGGLDTILTDERTLLETTYSDLQEKTQDQAQVAAQLVEKRRLLDRTLKAIIELEPTFDGT